MNEQPGKARDYSETLFLPKTDFPMRAGLPQERAGDPQALEEPRSVRAAARRRQRPAAIRPARRPALRQRQHPYRPRAQQDPQGRGDAKPADARLRFQLRARLGLPRPADRMEDRGGQLPRQGQAEAGFVRSGGAGRIPPGMPRLRRSTGSACSARSSSASAWSAIGRIPTPRWIFSPKRRLRARLMKFAANGTLYRGSKPVMWSVVEKTALAEAEVEYEDYTSRYGVGEVSDCRGRTYEKNPASSPAHFV